MDQDPIQIKGFDDQKRKKENSAKMSLFFDKKNIAIYYVQATGVKHFKKKKFINFFLCFWVIIALLDLDPDPDCESGSEDPI
jgi:hypothetical protein